MQVSGRRLRGGDFADEDRIPIAVRTRSAIESQGADRLWGSGEQRKGREHLCEGRSAGKNACGILKSPGASIWSI